MKERAADLLRDMMNERCRLIDGGAGLRTAEVHLPQGIAVRFTQVEINVECLSVQFHPVLLL